MGPDPGFGSDGFATAGTEAAGLVQVRFAFELADGNIVLAGSTEDDHAFVEILASDGHNLHDQVLDRPLWGSGLAHVFEHPDGGIVLAGRHYSGPDTGPYLSAVRLNADLSLDTSYGTDGWADTIDASNQQLHVLDGLDGSMVVALNTAIYRIGADGGLDTTFGGGPDGAAAVPHPTPYETTTARVSVPQVTVDGGVVVAGTAWGDRVGRPFVARLTASGQADTGFGGVGYVMPAGTDQDEEMKTILGLADGSVIVTTSRTVNGEPTFPPSPTHLIVRRFLPDGSPDPGFGTGGEMPPINIEDPPGSQRRHEARLSAAADGSIIAVINATWSGAVGTNLSSVARITPSGTLDPAFGPDGTGLIAWEESPWVLPLADGSMLITHPDWDIVDGVVVPGPLVVSYLDPTGNHDPAFNNGVPLLFNGQHRRPTLSTDAALIPILTTGTGAGTTSGGVLRILTNLPPPPPDVAGETVCGTDGYWLGEADGDIYPFGDAAHHGQPTPAPATTKPSPPPPPAAATGPSTPPATSPTTATPPTSAKPT